MKKIIITAVTAILTFSVHSAPIVGYSDVQDNGGGSFTFFFDTLPGPGILGEGDGLTFTGGGLNLTVLASTNRAKKKTGEVAPISNAMVIQDVPAHGGLGALSGTDTDNLEEFEWLSFLFDEVVTLTNITLNGQIGENGHQDDADGGFRIDPDFRLLAKKTTKKKAARISALDAADYDGTGNDGLLPFGGFDLDSFDIYPGLLKVACKKVVAPGGVEPKTVDCPDTGYFNGYVESITIQTHGVPEPPVLALLAIGLIGLVRGGIKRIGQKKSA